MTEGEPEKKKKRRQRQQQVLVQEQELSDQRIQKLALFLEELAKQGTYVDIQICPRCKSSRVGRVGSLGDVLGHMAAAPHKFRCTDCGWIDRIKLYATNKPLGVNEMAIVAEAYNLDKKQMEIAP